MPQSKPTPHLATEKSPRMRKADPNFLVRIQRSEWREIHAGKAHIRSDVNRCDSDIAHAWVFYFARDELREHTLDLGFNASLSLSFRHY
jgi:hypothetical protein